jgi:hypothetical protein
MTTHAQHYWFAGDDWQINAKLIDYTGAPFDLTGAPDIRWALMTEAGQTVLTEDDVNIIVIGEPTEGNCAIQVPAVKTSPLVEGQYNDKIRIVYAGIASTLAYGLVWVTADPWHVSALATQEMKLVV